jgi:hypothetical protein
MDGTIAPVIDSSAGRTEQSATEMIPFTADVGIIERWYAIGFAVTCSAIAALCARSSGLHPVADLLSRCTGPVSRRNGFIMSAK